jgi:NAD(P)-dependent dehydrogenase (short-subunit alcohol dehydrogenase family)
LPAIEYAPRGVRVNSVALAVIKTPDHGPASYSGMEALPRLAGWERSATSSTGSLYLERATFVTGTALDIDGGQVAGH